MGIDHSFSNEYNLFKKDHQEICSTKNQWGNVSFLQSKFSKKQKCVEKIIRFQDEDDYKNYKKYFKNFKSFKNFSLAKILTFSEGNQGFCANPDLSIALILECPQSSLQEVILKQNEGKQGEIQFLEQDDFLAIFNQLLDLFYSMHLFDLPLGEISPDNIFIEQNGDIKYVNSYLLTCQKQSIDYLKYYQDFVTTYAPEEFLILKFKTQESIVEYDYEKKSVFAFGITLLALISSQDYRIFYDYEDWNIKFDKVTKILNQLDNQGYNHQLDQILIEMLSREPYDRPSFSTIKKRLEKLQFGETRRLSTRFLHKVNQLNFQFYFLSVKIKIIQQLINLKIFKTNLSLKIMINSSKNSNYDERDTKWVDLQWNLQEIQLFLNRLLKRHQK